MKKLCWFLILFLLLPEVAYPAAVTLTNRRLYATGGLRVITGTTTLNSGDTLSVPLGTILYVGMRVRDNANTRSTNPTLVHGISGSTITIYTTENGVTVEFYVTGF